MEDHYSSPTLVLASRGEVLLLYRGKELSWNVAFYDKAAYSGEFNIFEQINAYWKTLPDETKDEIFNTYVEIRNIFENIWTEPELTRALQPQIKRLFDCHDLTAMRHWVDFRANIIRPRNLMESFDENSHEMPGTRERTYLIDDYQWLVTMTVALRAMHPIWGEYIFRTKEESGTMWKELWAAMLLNKSNLNNSIPMEKLKTYVKQSMPAEKSKATIIANMSSEDVDGWMTGLVLVRRLTVADIRGIDPTSNIVTFIYRYIDHKLKSLENNAPGGRVHDKNADSSNAESESNLSMLENYKSKQELPTGDICAMDNYINNYQNMARRLCPDLDMALLEEFVNAGQELHDNRIATVQVTLAQTILNDEVPAYVLELIPKTSVVLCIAVAQAILWHCNYRDLAALISGISIPNEEYSVSYTGSRSRIPKELVAKLDEEYPFSKRGSNRKSNVKTPSAGQVSVELMHDEFTQTDWRLTLPPKRVEELTGNKNNKRFSAPSDLRIQLSELIYSISQSEKAFHKPRGA